MRQSDERGKALLEGDDTVKELRGLVAGLLPWYQAGKRSMRWRDDPTPYHVWLSEIMLQQTRIEAVKGYFDRFVFAIPDIATLAATEEDKLLKLWEGLGYYNRIRNMRKAAVVVMEEYGGELPADYGKLLSLPGIGAYTAGAIASISYGIKAPCVDGNVLRVLMRFLDCHEDAAKTSTKKMVERLLMSVIPEAEPGDFNQGLMELGEVVCIPNGKPLCGKCPIAASCKGYGAGTAEALPVKAEKRGRKIEERTVLLLEYQGRYAIRKRPDKGLLGGLWEIPNVEGRLSKEALRDYLQKGCDYVVRDMGEAKHVFSHVEWHMGGYLVQCGDEGCRDALGSDLVWTDAEGVREKYALPMAFRHYKQYME